MPDTDTEFLCREVMPAEVYEVGGSIITKARVFITSRRLIVWALENGVATKRLEVELSEPVEASRSALGPRESIEVTTLTKGYLVNKGRGCGCGGAMMRLKELALPAPWEG